MMKKKIAALLLAGTLAVAPSYAVMAENASATEAPAEEKKEPVKDGTYDLKCSEDDKDEDAIQLHFSNEVRNDVTGNWRIATLASDKSSLDFALAYYKEFVTSKDEIHAVVNFTDQTVNLSHHPAEASDQNPHLILCIAGNRNLSASVIYLIHIFRKHFDLAGK